MPERLLTKQINVGNIKIGGQNRVVIQPMAKTKTKDVDATIKQIHDLEDAGCEVIRVAVLDMEDAKAIGEIKRNISIPLVADIHFNPDFVIEAIKQGVDKIRLNPGNIEDENKIKEIVELAKEKHIAIRIGLNAGSLNKKYKHSEEAMIESAKDHIRILEALDFRDICLSFKSSDPIETINAYKLAARTFPYPLHLGVTEVGDTVRISISDDPVKEVIVAKKLLKACRLYKDIPTLISCPTCGRIQYDMLPIVKEMEEYLNKLEKDVTVAIMGCPVNGPQEASRADIGVAGGKDSAILFKKGQIVRTVPQSEIVKTLKEEIEKF